MYQNDPVKVLTGEVRLSYVTVITPRASQPGEEAKYSVRIMIPKTDIATKTDIDASIHVAVQAAVSKVWDGVRPLKMNVPIYDGDGEKPNGGPYEDECRRHWVINASTKMKPGVIDTAGNDLMPSDIYSGMYGRVTIRFFGYSNRGNKGIGCGLGNIMKTRDGEPLAGNASASSDFAAMIQPAAPNYGIPTYTPPQTPAYQPPVQQQQYQQPAQPAAYPQQPAVTINPLTGEPI